MKFTLWAKWCTWKRGGLAHIWGFWLNAKLWICPPRWVGFLPFQNYFFLYFTQIKYLEIFIYRVGLHLFNQYYLLKRELSQINNEFILKNNVIDTHFSFSLTLLFSKLFNSEFNTVTMKQNPKLCPPLYANGNIFSVRELHGVCELQAFKLSWRPINGTGEQLIFCPSTWHVKAGTRKCMYFACQPYTPKAMPWSFMHDLNSYQSSL